MTVQNRDPVLRRKLASRTPPAPDAGADAKGPAQGLARAVARAVSAQAGLVAEPGTLLRRQMSLTELLDQIDVDSFVGLLGGGPAGPGLVIVDQAGFSGLVEAMTVGRLSARASTGRRPTPTDAALLAVLVDAALGDLGAQDPATACRFARPIADHRLLAIMLDETHYDLMTLPVTLLSGEVLRAAKFTLALPHVAAAQAEIPAALVEAASARTWASALEANVLNAPSQLRAELGRITLPLSQVLELGEGGCLMLPLANLEEVRLVSLDGEVQATGRLGQSRGMRAVRLTSWASAPAPNPPMTDAAPHRAAPARDLESE